MCLGTLSGLYSRGTRTKFSSFPSSSPPPGLGSSTASCTRLGRQPCQAPGPVTGMRTGTGSPLWENPSLANFFGHQPASTRWASDSPRPRLHQSPPPPSMSWHGKLLPGEREREAVAGFWNWLSKKHYNTLTGFQWVCSVPPFPWRPHRFREGVSPCRRKAVSGARRSWQLLCSSVIPPTSSRHSPSLHQGPEPNSKAHI